MKIFDCTKYNNEDLILDFMFNVLNKYIKLFYSENKKEFKFGKEFKLKLFQ